MADNYYVHCMDRGKGECIGGRVRERGKGHREGERERVREKHKGKWKGEGGGGGREVKERQGVLKKNFKIRR